ncbi:MAG TPA: AMP-binding protein, partial [Dehalococcoidia bacterium]
MVLGKLRMLGVNDEDERADTGDAGPSTFAELLEMNRRTWGDKISIQQKVRRDWQRFSHEDVYRRAHDLAAGFIAIGLKRGERVAIVLENSYDWVCAYYGIVLAGGVGVPVYYDLRPSEIEGMVEHAEPSMAVVSAKVRTRIAPALEGLRHVIVPGGAPGALSLDDVAASASAESRGALATIDLQPDDLASIVFTSGTSGGNKGVMLTHRNFMANLRQVRRSIPFNERDRLVMVLPLHHAFPFIVTVAVAPAVGGEVTFENDLRRIRDRMAEVKPTLFLGVPALFELMYRNIVHGIEAQGRLETFQKGLRIVEATKQRTGINIGRIVFRELHKRLGGSLRFMVSGGAALNPQTARDFAMLGVPILQGWGLSEASPVLSVQRWSPRKFYTSNYYEERFGSIGLPIDGVEIGLIDVPEKELYVHLHGEGELVARGDNITPGYWRAPEASAAIKVGEWLRTGDVGYIDDEGNIWITGRSKFVIVLESGEKVHPDEVEEKLQRSAVIEDIVVLGRKTRGKTQVTAVIYPSRDAIVERVGEASLTEDLVRGILREEIGAQEEDVAGYKRVVDVVLTDEPLPKTPLRKVMRGHIRENYEFNLDRWRTSWA